MAWPKCHGHSVAFGTFISPSEMLIYEEKVNKAFEPQSYIAFDQQRRRVKLGFAVSHNRETYNYEVEMDHRQIDSIHEIRQRNELRIVFKLKCPPKVYQIEITRSRHGRQSLARNRITAIKESASGVEDTTTLVDDGSHICIGRWLAYCFKTKVTGDLMPWVPLRDQLDTLIQAGPEITIRREPYPRMWDWLKEPQTSQTPHSAKTSSVFDLASTDVHLSFEVKYQLEVCISHGYLQESTLTQSFAQKLASLDETKPGLAQRLLEHIAEHKRVFTNPMDVFSHLRQISSIRAKPPSHCVIVQSATVTPTTIYFHSPTVEMSNRVLRDYHEHGRRFLRIRFRDENHIGKLKKMDYCNDDAVFARVKHVLDQGITVGGRKFEFLAYGNSQLREHGAYFFAPLNNLTAEDIRRKMGTFEEKVVAKHAARLGQCFSTTRRSWTSINIIREDDIERNGYNFTDGVGRMPTFVAQMIATHLRLPVPVTQMPSAYQIRIAGFKGIIVHDPTLKGSALHLRRSQEKFPAENRSLEICKFSQFSPSYLNQQLILILDVLGVSNSTILARQKSMITDLESAMHDGDVARQLLHKTVDQNQITLKLASMIDDGFMNAQEPFLTSCLRLWLSWSVKSLKDKARVLIPDGAYLLGCVDERAILCGHLNDSSDVPEIFVQITTTDVKTRRISHKVITGLCVVARNPSLHPGDIRVVRAVDVPELHHIRNLVVFPQMGDRDVPSMCSGGDLDGDDFLVIWDQQMLPQERNHEPMDYSPPAPRICPRPITIKDIASFFVEYIQNDRLGLIAVSHRYLADWYPEGAKHPDCLRLAHAHSCAVDYPKTGVPPDDKLPHSREIPRWANKGKGYENGKILHQLYGAVNYIEFKPSQEQFDRRILEAYPVNDGLLETAAQIKLRYDNALRRLMEKYEIQSEYEIWTAFVLKFNDELREWSLAETLGNAISAIRQQYRQIVFEAAGTSEEQQDGSKLGPFVTAMYMLAARDAATGRTSSQGMPLISFPWLFQAELGDIAMGRYDRYRLPVLSKQSSTPIPPTDRENQVPLSEHPKVGDATKAERSVDQPSKVVEEDGCVGATSNVVDEEQASGLSQVAVEADPTLLSDAMVSTLVSSLSPSTIADPPAIYEHKEPEDEEPEEEIVVVTQKTDGFMERLTSMVMLR